MLHSDIQLKGCGMEVVAGPCDGPVRWQATTREQPEPQLSNALQPTAPKRYCHSEQQYLLVNYYSTCPLKPAFFHNAARPKYICTCRLYLPVPKNK